jgi:hypothetical protein
MDDLVEFLRAQLDVEEQVAREATMGPWQNAPTASHHATATGRTEEAVFAAPPDKGATIVATTGVPSERQNLVNAEHIARHDPARVLRDVEARRALLDEHHDVNDGSCGTCVDGQWGYPTHGGSSPQRFPCRTLRLLALPYADHPDYNPEWRP